MNKTELMNNLTRTFGRVGLQVKKHSPEILMAAGIAGGIASAVMACKATTKLDSVLAESKEKIEKIHGYVEAEGFSEKYTEEDNKKDLAIVYTQSAMEVVKLYAPSVCLGALSIGSILAGHNILQKRNVALASAYMVVDKSFKEYRGRVIERFGQELDRELKYNIKAIEVEETVVDEKGKEKTVTKTVEVMDDPNNYSPYSVIYDDGCTGWEKNAEFNKMFLLRQQNYANERLQRQGHLFLNEVYDMLGVPRTEAGQVVGWYYDEKNPVGDNFVDFGIFNTNSRKARDFVNGYEKVIVLDFNVDGPIMQYL